MSKKILTLLAPVLAIAAFSVLPAPAQAAQPVVQTGGIQAAGRAAPNNQITIASENLVSTTMPEGLTFECAQSSLNIVMTSDDQGTQESGSLQGQPGVSMTGHCGSNTGLGVDITTNASLTNPWVVHFEENDVGKIQAVNGIDFTQQFQFAGSSVQTCQYEAENGEVPFSYTQTAGTVITLNEAVFTSPTCEELQQSGVFTTSSAGGTVQID